MPHPNEHLVLSKSDSWRMFDAISPRYDFLNHLLSLGLDVSWRRQLARFLPAGTGRDPFDLAQDASKSVLSKVEALSLLDVATGTADVLLTLVKGNPHIEEAVGIDLAEKMLSIGREKIARASLADKITLSHGDANHIPFEADRFDVVTIAFGIRNVEDHNRVLREMHRVLKKEGRALVLEFSLPGNAALRALHLFYLRTLVPLIGGIFSGHYRAYRYLNQTIETFPYGDDFCALMEFCGFKNVKAAPLMGGIATIYVGEKQ